MSSLTPSLIKQQPITGQGKLTISVRHVNYSIIVDGQDHCQS